MGASSVFRGQSVWLKLLHSIHKKAMSKKHIHNMKPFQRNSCKLISNLNKNKGMVEMMLVLCPSNSPGQTYMGP